MATKKSATKKVVAVPPTPKLHRVMINENDYKNDPVYLVMALTSTEAAQKAVARFSADHPASKLEELTVDLEPDTTFIA